LRDKRCGPWPSRLLTFKAHGDVLSTQPRLCQDLRPPAIPPAQ
jgi:hypothetical protein